MAVWKEESKSMSRRFVTLFLKTENVHLLKDVGMIPYYLQKNHGYDSVIATYKNNEEYPYLEKEVKGLKLDFVKKSSLPSSMARIIDGIHYIKANSESIDVLNIYHLNLASFFYSIAFKHYNKKGKIYLKLDMNPVGLVNCLKKDLRGLIKRSTIKKCDIVSVETKAMQEELNKHFDNKIIYVTNGCFVDEENEKPAGNLPYKKEKTILTVGNLGTYEKATDVLMEAFAKSSDKHDYKLKLVGPVADSFKAYVDEFYKKYPDLKERVIFTGPITDKKILLAEYEKAEYFTLPSLTESFGIVLVEAAREGCYLITSDMVPAGIDISDNGKYGTCVKAGSIDSLADTFTELCNKEFDSELSIQEAEFVRATFNWPAVSLVLGTVLSS